MNDTDSTEDRALIGVQFVDDEGDWPLYHWPAVPRIGECVVLPIEMGYEHIYVVRRCVWEDGIGDREGCCATLFIEHVGEAGEVAETDAWPDHTERSSGRPNTPSPYDLSKRASPNR